MENTTCAAFGDYEEVPETLPLNFMEDDLTWAASKLSGAAGALGEEEIYIRNWLLHYECASEELRVVVARLAYWTPPPLGRLSHTNGLSPGSSG